MRERLSPFLVLLEARYLPLLLLALPQAYAVALWLDNSNSGKPFAEVFAVIGASAFEFSYVGVIAWAERKVSGNWVWGTSLLALIFSVLVAVRVYWKTEDVLALLHAGFPIVAFGYTMVIHSTSAISTIEVKSEITRKQKSEKKKFRFFAWLLRKKYNEIADSVIPAIESETTEPENVISYTRLLQETEPAFAVQTKSENSERAKRIQQLYAQLGTWQAVADHEGKSVRTVQLWAKGA